MSQLVSIIVPVYNCERYLARTLESIRVQSYEYLDIILIDDGSVDRSGKICDEFCRLDSRFRVISQTNQGPGQARNTGLRASKGEYVCFIDAGDYIHSRAVETLMRQIDQGADLVMMSFVMTDSLDEDTSSEVNVVKSFEISQEQLVFNLVSTSGGAVFAWSVVWNKIYRKSIITDLFFSDLMCNEDQEFNLQVYLRINKAVCIENVLYFYYQSPNSIVRNPSTRPTRLYTQTLSRYHMLGFLTDKDKPTYKGWMLDYLYRQMLVRRDLLQDTLVESDFRVLSNEILQHTFKGFFFNRYISIKRKIKFVLKWLRLF